ncbi:MAG: hypothetical protein R3F59_04910 [Myxococcota bacterium]
MGSMLWAMVWLGGLLTGCSGGAPAAALEQAQAQLEAADWAGAEQTAAEALGRPKGDPSVRWQLELVRVEAEARSGRGSEARQQLERLAAEYPPQISAALYATTATQAADADDPPGARSVIEAGLARFPDDPALVAASRRLAPAPEVVDAQEGGPDLTPPPEGPEAEGEAAAGAPNAGGAAPPVEAGDEVEPAPQ